VIGDRPRDAGGVAVADDRHEAFVKIKSGFAALR
jgi:hypothetical protein